MLYYVYLIGVACLRRLVLDILCQLDPRLIYLRLLEFIWDWPPRHHCVQLSLLCLTSQRCRSTSLPEM